MTLDEINKKIARLLNEGDDQIELLTSSFEKRIIESHKKSLDEIKKRVARIYEKLGDNFKYADVASYNRLNTLEKKIISELEGLGVENLSTIEESIKEIFSQSYYRTAFGLEASTGVDLGFGLLNPNVTQAILLNPLDRITWPERLKKHEKNYIDIIRTELDQGFKLGDGYGKIAKALTEKTEMQKNKIFKIIRTEGHRAQSAARISGFDESESSADRLGIKTARIWISTLDLRTRDSHKSMNGKEAELIDDLYKWTHSSGVETEGPGLSGIASEDIHCRCTTILKILSLPKDNRAPKSYQDFDNWYDKRIKKAA